MQKPPPKIVIYSSVREDWGGCEELWFRTVPQFLASGYQVYFVRFGLNPKHPKISLLDTMGVCLIDLKPSWRTKYLTRRFNSFPESYSLLQIAFSQELMRIKPQLVVVSQAINFDGLPMANVCLHARIPYVTIAQKAVESYWPGPQQLSLFRLTQLQAIKSLFVSKRNLAATELQLGLRLPKAEVLLNPVKLLSEPIPFPDDNSGIRFACLGRYFVLDKGQDLLLQIMAKPQWRERKVVLDLIGYGQDEGALLAGIKLLELENVNLIGYIPEAENIWNTYHALLLPSRYEGRPLVMLEAMAAGRVCVVSNAGGNDEVIENGFNGFVSEPTLASFEQSMEEAWNKREDWQEIGNAAFETIRRIYVKSAEEIFSDTINALLNELPT